MEIDQLRCSTIPPHLQRRFVHVRRSFCLPMTQMTSSKSSMVVHSSLSEPKSENRMFILGMGFVGQLLAHKLQNQGWVVSGTCTSHAKKKRLEDIGFQIYHFDANKPKLNFLECLNHYTHLLVTIPSTVGTGDPVLQHEELLRSSLVNGDLRWLCYVSSTSIYGDCGGELVDEDYPTNPATELAKLRLASEEGWSNLAHNLGLSPYIFRLGGIYGPGRSAIDTIINRGPLSEGQKMRRYRKYTSRVHVEDICQALAAAVYSSSPGKVYNIVDDDPSPREQVFEYARSLVEEKWPDLMTQQPEEKEGSNVKTRNKRGEKRVCNARMKKELGVQLLYPDYRTGLQSILDQIDTPPFLVSKG